MIDTKLILFLRSYFQQSIYLYIIATKVPYSVLKESTITVSSTLTYGGIIHVKENIFSANIDEVRYLCFHSQSEEFPFVEVQLAKPIVVDSMYLQGRSDGQMRQGYQQFFILF
jgi:hypothetical protein